MEIKGQVRLMIENTLEPFDQICYVVDSSPRNLDVILGQISWMTRVMVFKSKHQL
jgi:hypothetical protein